MNKLKRKLYEEVCNFQSKTIGTETLQELMSMKSKWGQNSNKPKINILLNHFKRKTLCVQFESLLEQTLSFHQVLLFQILEYLSLKKQG
jgi:hypothetical protein